MTSRQHKWIKDSMGSKEDYVAHLEDALLRACERLADGDQSYEDADIPMGWFEKLLAASTIHPKTGESPIFLKYK
ncbi:MAG: hypothetical protein DDT31_01568 [Syntrophomonadaceae bacterium]|nr:hypothetical protein [Bacillota bacterium]